MTSTPRPQPRECRRCHCCAGSPCYTHCNNCDVPDRSPQGESRPEAPPPMPEVDRLRADNETLRTQLQRAREALGSSTPAAKGRCGFFLLTGGGLVRCIFTAGHPDYGHTCNDDLFAPPVEPTARPAPLKKQRTTASVAEAALDRVRALPDQPGTLDPTNENYADYLIGYRNAMNRVRRTIDNEPATTPPNSPEIARERQGGTWVWRCNGAPGCDGWAGIGLASENAARREYDRHAAREHLPMEQP